MSPCFFGGGLGLKAQAKALHVLWRTIIKIIKKRQMIEMVALPASGIGKQLLTPASTALTLTIKRMTLFAPVKGLVSKPRPRRRP